MNHGDYEEAAAYYRALIEARERETRSSRGEVIRVAVVGLAATSIGILLLIVTKPLAAEAIEFVNRAMSVAR